MGYKDRKKYQRILKEYRLQIIHSFFRSAKDWKFPVISVISLFVSIFSIYNTYQRNNYFDRTNFNIIQNLWQENPTYTLYNESQKPLSYPPPGIIFHI